MPFARYLLVNMKNCTIMSFFLSRNDTNYFLQYFWLRNVCHSFQIKIEFDLFDLADPNPAGECATDFFLATGGSPVPQLCGLNTGHHGKSIKQINIFAWSNDFLFSYLFRNTQQWTKPDFSDLGHDSYCHSKSQMEH